MEIIIQKHLNHVDKLFLRACLILNVKNATWKPMTGRTAPVNTARDYSEGYTDIERREVTLDIFTPKRRDPRSSNGLLRLIAHELAHIQKPPYKERYKGRWINRIHYPEFYEQVNKNVDLLKQDAEFRGYFRH